jgi:hypothetical protein
MGEAHYSLPRKSASTQTQALCALLFLYREVLQKDRVQIFWNNVPNGLRIMDQCGFPREEHLLESHRERGFIPEGYKPLAGG